MNEIKVNFELSKATMVLIVLSLGIGYLLGNVFQIPTLGGGSTGKAILPNPPPSQPTQQQPSLVQVSVDDDPSKGNENAEVYVIEFSDFECPFCGRFYTQTLPQLETDYIDTGKILFIYRDFPLESIHPLASPAAQASECADEQGKFWEFHDKLFDNQQIWSTVGASEFKRYASEVGLNTDEFDNCLDNGDMAEEVQNDFQDGVSAGVSGTPTFFIGNPQEGYEKVVGAQPYSVIKQVIDSYL